MAKSNSGKVLVIVESPTKAKTIRKFLGRDFMVESCMGHIRDLPESKKDIPEKWRKQAWATLGVNVDSDFDPIYCVPKSKTKVVDALRSKLKDARELILATDEDREGESISWHLKEVLKPKVPTKRMVFHEITKEAIQKALKDFRNIDDNLVRAQEARRILDRLVGYTISPLLWKKVAYGLSAGRVQSVAVRLICERELERLKFKKSEYWTLNGTCEKDKSEFETRIFSWQKQRIALGKDFDGTTGKLGGKGGDLLILDSKKAEAIRTQLKGETWKVIEVEEKPVQRKAPPPFITSTLQQEANRKLGMGSREAMRVAQSLYEQGFITYMRTDSTNLSEQALSAARKKIAELYGKTYLPDQPRVYVHKRPKGAQEAHEAIRPAGEEFVEPDSSGLKGMELKLYEMIYRRTLACQMPDSRQRQVTARFQVGPALFVASGATVEFPGFLKAYEEGSDEEVTEEKESKLPKLTEGDVVKCLGIESLQHETKPPARFTEASLVQTMEKEGIGRPSTYAPTISTIIDRGYVRKVGSALVPTFTAIVVNKMLTTALPQFVDLAFTSKMEDSLDEIASGDLDSVQYLKDVYLGKTGLKAIVTKKEKEVDPEEARAIRFETIPGYEVRVGRYGAYICRLAKKKGDEEVCASLPESQMPADVSVDTAERLIEQKQSGNDSIGKDPSTGKPVFVLTGRYGPYVQLGESTEEKVKRVSIPPSLAMDPMDLPLALKLLALPKTLGTHPTTQKDIRVGYGRFGPYVVCDGDFRSVPKGENFLELELPRALELLAQPKKGRGASTPLREIGNHPEDNEKIMVFDGKYGPYIKWGKTNVSVPEGKSHEKISLADAIELLAAKKASAPAKRRRRSA